MRKAMEQILPSDGAALIQENSTQDVETTAPHDHVDTPSNSRVVDDDGLDTMLRLSLQTPPVSRKSPLVKRQPSRLFGCTKNQTLSLSQETDDVIYDAMPLRWVRASDCSVGTDKKKRRKQMCGDAINGVDTTLKLSSFPVSRKSPPVKSTATVPFRLLGTTIHVPDKNQNLSLSLPAPDCGVVTDKKKRKRMRGDAINPRLKRTRVVGGGDDENQEPSVPIEQIPGLMQAGVREAVFLYRKKLEVSDVEKGKNRLFVTKKERVMKFLKEEEVQVVEGDGRGLKMKAVDGGGQLYQNMGCTKWISLNMLVINSDWRKLVVGNNARKGDVVEIWGYREAHNPCLAFKFIHAPPPPPL